MCVEGFLRVLQLCPSLIRWACSGQWSTCCSGPSCSSSPSTLSLLSVALVWPSWWPVSPYISWESTGKTSHSALIILWVRKPLGGGFIFMAAFEEKKGLWHYSTVVYSLCFIRTPDLFCSVWAVENIWSLICPSLLCELQCGSVFNAGI